MNQFNIADAKAHFSELVTRFELLRFGPEMAEVYFLRSVPLRLALRDATGRTPHRRLRGVSGLGRLDGPRLARRAQH